MEQRKEVAQARGAEKVVVDIAAVRKVDASKRWRVEQYLAGEKASVQGYQRAPVVQCVGIVAEADDVGYELEREGARVSRRHQTRQPAFQTPRLEKQVCRHEETRPHDKERRDAHAQRRRAEQ